MHSPQLRLLWGGSREPRTGRKGAGPTSAPGPQGTAGSSGWDVKKPLQVDPTLVPPKESRPRASTWGGAAHSLGPSAGQARCPRGPGWPPDPRLCPRAVAMLKGTQSPHDIATDKEPGAPVFGALSP